jgi:chromate transport protein ChrA
VFLRASSLHIGAAAATAAVRDELVANGRIEGHEVDSAYAVSRITPGTNLLALYAVLGHRLGGWRLAVQAVAVGVGVPALVTILIAFSYRHSQSPIVNALMAGARAGGVAILLGAAVRLVKPQISAQPKLGLALAIAATVAASAFSAPVFVILGLSGVVGAFGLKPL